MTTASGMPASIASVAAALVKAAGTKMTLTSAPVASIASATEPNTGTEVPPSNSTVVPALRGLTPPTIEVPERSIRWVCFMPSEPVMPWTMTLESAVRKMAMGVVSLFALVGSVAGGQLGGLAGGAVHGVLDEDAGVVALGEDAPALLDVVAVEAHHQRAVLLLAEGVERADDAVGHGVAGRDAAEDVDEDAPDLGVGQDDVQPVGHHLGARAATDVEEVGRLLAAELLAGVGDDVEGAHDETRTVADDADGAVELDVVEVLLLGRCLERVRVGGVLERLVVGVAEAGVLVERHLAVERDDLAVLGLDEGVDLDERGVLLAVDRPQLLDDVGDGRLVGLVEARGVDDLLRLRGVDARVGVDGDARQGLGALDGELLDLHAALLGAHGEVGAVGTVEQHREVVLLGDAGTLGDHHGAHGVALDVHPEDGLGGGLRLVGALRHLDATGLAAAAGLHLPLDDGDTARLRSDLLSGRSGLLRGGGDGAGQHGHPVLLEHVAGLVLEEIHGWGPSSSSIRIVVDRVAAASRGPRAHALALGRALRRGATESGCPSDSSGCDVWRPHRVRPTGRRSHPHPTPPRPPFRALSARARETRRCAGPFARPFTGSRAHARSARSGRMPGAELCVLEAAPVVCGLRRRERPGGGPRARGRGPAPVWRARTT